MLPLRTHSPCHTHHPIQFLRGCIGIRGVGRLASRRPIRRVRAVISGRLPIIKRNESIRGCMCDRSRVHVRRHATVCVYRLFRQGDGERWIFSRLFLTRGRRGRLSSRPFDVFGPATPIAFHRRKEKGKESSPSRRASDKTKHPGGCLRAAPVIRNVEGRIWYNGRASSCAREPKKRGRRDARSGKQDASGAPRGSRVDSEHPHLLLMRFRATDVYRNSTNLKFIMSYKLITYLKVFNKLIN